HAHGFGFVVALHLAAEYRAILDRGVEHAGQLDVDAVDHLAVGLVDGVEPLDGLADDLPVLRVLELDLFRRLELRGRLGNLPVGRGAARRLVRNHAIGDAALGRLHLPFVGGGLDQHFARRRAALADVFMRLADAAAAAGREVAPRALARDALAGRRIFGRDLRPVALELFSDELGEAGQRALAHLRAGDADHYRLVGADHHPGGDFGAGIRSLRGGGAERKLEAEREAATSGSSAGDERAAIDLCDDLGHVIHGGLPYALAAAAWIASRTCWKVPHRQMLVMASLMSASVGFGFSLRSAATAMIMPLWQ